MGYESRLYIVRRSGYVLPNGNTWVYGEEIAQFNLCVMNPAFRAAFTKEIDYTVYDEGEATSEDKYGDKLRSADVQTVIDVLRSCEAEEHYRRIPPVIAALEAYKAAAGEWENEIEVVHFGY